MGFVLPNDFKELLESLNKNRVRYLLVGGYAVGIYGYPRATNDLDIFVAANEENATRVVEALKEFGFGGESLTPELFTRKDSLVVLGVEPLAIDPELSLWS